MKQHDIIRQLFFFALLLVIVTGCKKHKNNDPLPQTKDSLAFEGRQYPILVIGNQVWTTVNHSGPGGASYNATGDKQEYGKYYAFEEVIAIPLPEGWRLPTKQDYIELAQHEGVTFTGNQAINQEAIKRLVSVSNWRSIPGTNASGFNARPAGYIFQNQPPLDGEIAEFWTKEGYTVSIQETANGKTHKISFYGNSNSPEYRFNLRIVRNK